MGGWLVGWLIGLRRPTDMMNEGLEVRGGWLVRWLAGDGCGE